MVKTWSTCLDGPGFEVASDAVAQAVFCRAAMVDRGIFPECADFINNRDAKFARHLDGGECIEHRGMGMNNVRSHFAGDFFKARFQLPHQRQFLGDRQAGERTGRHRSPVEAQAVDILYGRRCFPLLGRREVKGFPAEGALFAQERRGTEGVAAVQGN